MTKGRTSSKTLEIKNMRSKILLVLITIIFLKNANIWAGTFKTNEFFLPEHYFLYPDPYNDVRLAQARYEELKRLFNELQAKGDIVNSEKVYPVMLQAKIDFLSCSLIAKRNENILHYGFCFFFTSPSNLDNEFKRFAEELLKFELPFRAFKYDSDKKLVDSRCRILIKKNINDLSFEVQECKNFERTVILLFKKKIESLLKNEKEIEFYLSIELIKKPEFTYEIGSY